MYYYWGFELNIASDIEIPELLPAQFEQQPDLTIRLAKVHVNIQQEASTGKLREYIISSDEYYLDVKKVC
ncbi:MAG: hypothetical protein JWQ38_828, partial [Flavipsychrobacter sp.]|nr:hypothetical protein [Flavipsychrobacter sp.]